LPRDVLVVLDEGSSIEPLLETSERLERALADEAPTVLVGGVGFMLPSERSQAEVGRVIRESGVTGEGAREGIQTAAKSAGFRPDTFAPFLDRIPRLLDPAERITYDGLVRHGLDQIVSRFLIRRNRSYEAVTYLYPQQAADVDALTRAVQRVDPRLRLTGLPAIDHELGRQFLPQFLKGIAIGTVAVLLIIYVVFRTIRHTLLALLPTAIGFVWSAGLLALLKVELDLFSVFAAVTFIGIAVDYGIYVLYRYLFEPPGDMSDVMAKTGAAITIACGTALIGFGTLINSSYRPLHVFGIVSIVTLSCCLLASVVSLPALIIQTDRWSRSAR
jgi:predicted exporter